jgi:LmbE family N-acetylglucosaminyl deacetylase
VIHLGYADSGHGPLFHPDPPDRTRFARADTEQAAAKLADLLREENVDVLLSYDAQGGYGHRDHVKVHEVGARAAQMADTPVLEATRPREPIYRMYRTLRFLRLPINTDPQEVRDSYYSPRATITHQIDVRRYARQKCIALAAHRSQMSGSSRANIAFRVLLHLPTPILGLAFGREWFIDPTTPPGATPIGDILQNLR